MGMLTVAALREASRDERRQSGKFEIVGGPVGAVCDRAYFVDSVKSRAHRARLQLTVVRQEGQ